MGDGESNQTVCNIYTHVMASERSYNRQHFMDVLDTQINSDDPSSAAMRVEWKRSSPSCASRSTRASAGGGERYLQRHREQGKLPVRERISRLLDPGSPLLEFSPLAAWDMYDNEAPGAGS